MNYLIYGTSFNLIDKEIEKIILSRPHTSYNLDEIALEEILEDISYNSMFDEEKVIVLKNFNSIINSKKDNEKRLERLKEYLLEPNQNTTLIFTSNEKISSRGSSKDIITKLQTIETPIITKPYELAKLLGEDIKRCGFSISQNALNIFSEKCLSNYDIALKELEKIKSFKKDNKFISEDDIEKYVSNYNLEDMFGFKDAVINKNFNKAFQMLDDLEASKVELVPLVVMLAKEYQVLYNIKILSAKKLANDQIGETLNKMHPYRVKLLREASSKYTEEELEHLILELCNLDLKIVSEDNLGFDELRKILLEL